MRRLFTLLFLAGLTGCTHLYSVTALPDEGHYVVTQTTRNGGMKVYDCLSAPEKKYDPTCTKVAFK